MATRTLTTRLAVDGETAYKRAMTEVNGVLRTQKSEMTLLKAQFMGQMNTTEALTAKEKILRDEIAQQEEKVRSLEDAVKDATKTYGEADKRTSDWQVSLNNAKKDLIQMNRELDDTARYLEEAEDSADGCATSIDGFGKSTKDTKSGLGGFLDSLDKFKGIVAGSAIVGGLNAAKDAILELEESTREYRRIMGSLEVSARQAGYSAEETAEAYDYLYGVLGDPQATATTLANLQAVGLEQKELMVLIDQAVGAWNQYGDSIPIDGLAEAINETIRAGQVTGNFADVLNWGSLENENFGVTMKENIEFTQLSSKELEKLTDQQREEYEATKAQYDAIVEYNEGVADAITAEDRFNIALANCETQAERTQLVIDTLTKMGLAEAGEAWRDVNGDIVNANNSQNRMEQAMGRLGEAIAPAANAIRNVGAGAVEYFAGMIEGATELVKGFLTWWDKFLDADTNEVDKRRAEARGYTGYDKVDTSKYSTGPSDTSAWADGSHASGLERVPWDGYNAELHKDEAVLSADEADWWRAMKRGTTTAQEAPKAETPVQSAPPADERPIQITTQVMLNGRKVGESVTNYQRNEERARGK